MAQFTGPSVTELPGWRVGILFLLFLVITVTWDRSIAALDRYLRRRGKRALRHVVKRLQNELLVLGLLSLMLVAFESYLLKICIPCGSSCSWDCPAQEAEAAGGTAAEGSSAGGQRRLQLAGAVAPALLGGRSGSSGWAGGSGRLLLAADKALDAYSCYQASETCGPGSEPFWSQLAIIQSHVFLFLIALIQILYACVSMLICLWKLRRWRRYERAAVQQDLRPLHSRFLPQPGDNAVTHALRCTASMLTDSVNAEVYCALRRLFIERLDLDRGFDFHGFLVEAMEEELAGIVGVNPLLWLIVIVWIMLPSAAYTSIWLTGLSVAALGIVGIKLQSIIIALAQAAYQLYGSQQSVHGRPSKLEIVKLRLQRLSPFKSSSQDVAGCAANLGSSSSEGGEAACSERGGGGGARRSAGFSLLASCGLGRRDTAADPAAAGAAAAGGVAGAAGAAGAGAADQDAADLQPSALLDSDSEEEEQQPEAEVASALVDEGAPPEDAAAVAAAAGTAARQQAMEEAADLVGRGSLSFSRGLAGDLPPQQAPEQQHVERQLEQQLSFDLEAQRQPAQAARAAAAAAAAPHPSSAVFRRCCAGLLPRLPWHRASQRRRVSTAVQRSQSFAENYRGPDAASLFWFGKPRVAMRIIQVVYLENGLSIAAVLFSVWQNVDFDWQRYGGWPFLVGMVCAEVLLLVFMSLLVLPVYALTTAAGSHSAASVIQHALRKNIKPDLARALQRMSLQRVPSDGDEGGGAAKEEGGQAIMPQEGSHSSGEAAQQAQQTQQAQQQVLPAHPQLELQPLASAGWGGPPSLARHSAPLPALLHRLSTAAPPSNGAEFEAAPVIAAPPGEAGASDALASPFTPASLDPAALAAVAAAAAAPGAGEAEEEGQRSITRLMGAMYARQLQRQLERSSARSLRAAHSTQLSSRGGSRALERGPSGSWRGSQEGSRHGLPRRSSLPQLDAAGAQGPTGSLAAARQPSGHGVPLAADEHSAAPAAAAPGQQQQQHVAGVQPDCEDCDLSVETCPAAVGALWLPTLMQHLSPAAEGGSSPGDDGSSGEQSSGGPDRSHGGAAASERQPSPSGSAGPPPAGRPRLSSSSVTPQRIPSSSTAPQPQRIPSSSMAPQRIPSSSSHRTLAEVRGLFDAARWDGGGS